MEEISTIPMLKNILIIKEYIVKEDQKQKQEMRL
jgi:hypothetical protein